MRSFSTHLDQKTHIHRVFAGSEPLGIFGGSYDPVKRAVVWEGTAEAWLKSATEDDSRPEGWRVMAFEECGGKFYATVGPALYQRMDGASPVWKKVYTATFPPQTDMKGNGGLRE